jgi:hypothetical protein
MAVLQLRSFVRSSLCCRDIVVLVFARASAESQVLDGHPVSVLKAAGTHGFTWPDVFGAWLLHQDFHGE